MTTEQVITGIHTMWPPNRTATRDLNEDFARMVFGVKMPDLGVIGGFNNESYLIVSVITPISREVFNWEAAENRADWEERHGRFREFSNVKDLLSYLHS